MNMDLRRILSEQSHQNRLPAISFSGAGDQAYKSYHNNEQIERLTRKARLK